MTTSTANRCCRNPAGNRPPHRSRRRCLYSRFTFDRVHQPLPCTLRRHRPGSGQREQRHVSTLVLYFMAAGGTLIQMLLQESLLRRLQRPQRVQRQIVRVFFVYRHV